VKIAAGLLGRLEPKSSRYFHWEYCQWPLGLTDFSAWSCAFLTTAARFPAHLAAHWQGAVIRKPTISVNYSEG